MKNRVPNMLALGCLSLALATPAHAEIVYGHPALGDSYLAWTLHRMETMYGVDDFMSDDDMVSRLLVEPTSIYSEVLRAPPSIAKPSHDETWRLMRDEQRRKREASWLDDVELRREMAWDLGLAKALPGHEVLPDPTVSTPGHIHLQSAANLYKAGVTLPIWEHAVNLADGRGGLTTLGSELAISVQLLVDWAAATPQEAWRRNGIDVDIARRFEQANSLADLSDGDLAYLASILRSELSRWRAGRAALHGEREVPTPLRLARATMVHHEQSTPESAPCLSNGRANMANAATSPEDLSHAICTTDATDRAVYRRYRKLREKQIHAVPTTFVQPEQAERLVRIFGPIRPAWAGFFRGDAMDYANHAEVIEAQMAVEAPPGDESDARFWRLIERANLLVCRSAVR